MKQIKTSIWFMLGMVVLLFGFQKVRADDLVSWTKLNVGYRMTPKLKLATGVEFRLKNRLRDTDRFGLNVGGAYRVWSFLQMDAAYEYHAQAKGERGWKSRNRYYFGGELDFKSRYFRLRLRERWQQTFSGGSVESRFRTREKGSFTLDGKSRFSPYLSMELYQPVGDRPFFWTARMRYTPGIEIKLTSHSMLDLYYCHQYEPKGSRNVLGFELNLSF